MHEQRTYASPLNRYVNRNPSKQDSWHWMTAHALYSPLRDFILIQGDDSQSVVADHTARLLDIGDHVSPRGTNSTSQLGITSQPDIE